MNVWIMRMEYALEIAEILSKNEPIKFEGVNPREYGAAREKWIDTIMDFDEYLKMRVIDYNSEQFIKKCYNLV